MLTSIAIRKLKPKSAPYKVTDGKGLVLEVRPSGKKLWRYRYRIAGKENLFAAGEWVDPPVGEDAAARSARVSGGFLTLEEARAKRLEWRGLVKQGIHPGHERQAARNAAVIEGENTFAAVADRWIAANRAHWSAYYLKQVERGMRGDVFPAIGRLPIRTVNSAHLLAIVKRAESRGAPTVALNLRQWCGAVFRFAISHLLADSDPAGAIKGAVKRPAVKHHAPLAMHEIPALLGALESYGGYRPTVIAMKLLLLTFVRPGELRGAKWTEFDLDGAVWRIPADRMKMGQEHLVPISAPALDLLRELRTLTGGQSWLFPNLRRPKECMTMTTLNRALERMGYGGRFSSHGFRATASTALNEMGFRPDLIERQLAHAERNKSRASYNQAMYLEDRRRMMEKWAATVLTRSSSKVLPFRGAVA